MPARRLRCAPPRARARGRAPLFAAAAALVQLACAATGDGDSSRTDPPASTDGSGTTDAGLPDTSSGSSSTAADTSTDDGSTTAMADTSSSSSSGETGIDASQWSVFAHSCPGASRTDALLVEGDTMWVGCGTNQTGYGLHGSTDGGATWQVVQTEPRLGQFRVSAIARGDDGLLYVAGINAGNGAMVAALDTSVALPTVTPVLRAGNVVGTSFHVGSLALLSEGRILAESLTGLGALYRRDASIGASATMWEDHYYWANGGMPPGYQMQDLVVHDDALYGCGATIAQPPYVFLPPRDDAAPPWALEVVELPHGGTGEMWGVAANDDRVVVVGVDQDADVGKIYVSGTDPYDAAAYAQTDLPAIVGEGDLGTWARGVCMQGDRIAVVGERQPLASDTGLVVLSVDGGASFVDITPTDDVTESVSKCAFTPEGALVVAGAAGLFAIYE